MASSQFFPKAADKKEVKEVKEVKEEYCLDDFMCPISQCIMLNPYNVKGTPHNFDYVFILEWLGRKETNPLTQERLVESDLIPNVALKNKIDAYLSNAADAKELKKESNSAKKDVKSILATFIDKMKTLQAKKKNKKGGCTIL